MFSFFLTIFLVLDVLNVLLQLTALTASRTTFSKSLIRVLLLSCVCFVTVPTKFMTILIQITTLILLSTSKKNQQLAL